MEAIKANPLGKEEEVKENKEYIDPLKDKDDLQVALMTLLSDFDRLEETNRNYNIRIWKKCENYWHHIQNNYWSELAQDWRSPGDFFKNNPDNAPTNIDDIKIINIYRAHGESIVAALSVNTPSVRFFPNDADEADDIVTSKAFSKIAKMIERQNNSKLLLMRMIYILFNQGFVAIHNYSHESEEYGTIATPIYDKKKVYFSKSLCTSCGETLAELGPFDKEPEKKQDEIPVTCPSCNNEVTPETETEERETQFKSGEDEKPKCRQKLNVYGPLNVKVSSYAYDQKSLGILVLDCEHDIAKAQDMYPNIAGEMPAGPLTNQIGVQARMPNNMFDSYTRHNVTVRQVWFRPWMFNAITKTGDPNKDEIVLELKKLFPDGCCLHAVNDKYAESHKENLDTAWSLSFNPLSRFIHSDPIGLGLIPVQDMKNEMVNLELESMEYGVPETFVDPEVLNLEAYRNAQGGPGMVFPVKVPIPGQDISKSFYQGKTSTLTDEAGRLETRIDGHGQFVTGDYPSIYGGPNSGDTAAEYSMSRQQALQRLSITWTIINFLWADVMKRSTLGYVSNLKQDEKYVQDNGTDFVSIWIKKDELAGSIGEVYPEGAEQFPISWAQQREVLMTLMQQQNPLVDAVIADPNNRTEIATLLGLPDLYIPGDQDRRKQLNEISRLVQEEPMEMGLIPGLDGMPQPQFKSSIDPEPKIDEDDAHISACKHWLNSEVGQFYKESKPSKYMNVVLHMEAHEMNLMASMQSQMPQGNPEGEGNEKPQNIPSN